VHVFPTNHYFFAALDALSREFPHRGYCHNAWENFLASSLSSPAIDFSSLRPLPTYIAPSASGKPNKKPINFGAEPSRKNGMIFSYEG
jgi:hypothetical protein